MKDILLDAFGNLVIRDGELAIGDACADVAQRVTYAYSGEYKENPTLGGNVQRMIAGAQDPFLIGHLKKQLKQCKIDAEIEYRNNRIEIKLK